MEQHLEQALKFLQIRDRSWGPSGIPASESQQNSDEKRRLIELLTQDMLQLDSGDHPEKKKWSQALDNVLSQLEGQTILLGMTGDRREYLPPGHPSDWALNKVFATGPI